MCIAFRTEVYVCCCFATAVRILQKTLTINNLVPVLHRHAAILSSPHAHGSGTYIRALLLSSAILLLWQPADKHLLHTWSRRKAMRSSMQVN